MVASTRVQALAEGSALLSVLSEFLKDKKLIQSLEEEVVKLNKLTDDESDQLHEAKILIQQRDSLTAEIAEQRKTLSDELKSYQAQFEKDQKQCDDYIATEHAELDNRTSDLDSRQADLDDYSSRLDQREAQLKEKAAVVNGLFGG